MADVLFADDITKVIVNYNNDRGQLALTSQRETECINQYEKKWKINTNINKFNVLSISKSRPESINIEGRRATFSNKIKMLGLTIKRTGVSQHMTNRIKQAKAQNLKLKQFIRLDSSIKLHLCKALIRPVMEYPIIPNGITSDMNIIKIQRVQNKNLKFVAAYTTQQHCTIEDLHKYYEIDAMNVRLYKAAKKLWDKMAFKEQQLHNRSTVENNNPFRDHYWWKRAALSLEGGEPDPIYT